MALSREQFINWLGYKGYAPTITNEKDNVYFVKGDRQYYVMEDRTELSELVKVYCTDDEAHNYVWAFRATYWFKDMQIAYDGTLVIAIQD